MEWRESEGQLFTGRRDATDVGKQSVVLQSGQGLLQRLGRVEVVDDHPKAPQVRRFGADQLKHQLQRGMSEEKQVILKLCFCQDVKVLHFNKSG